MIDDAETYGVARGAIKRGLQPQDIVGTAVFLASEASAMMTGQTIVVDGGAAVSVMRCAAFAVTPGPRTQPRPPATRARRAPVAREEIEDYAVGTQGAETAGEARS